MSINHDIKNLFFKTVGGDITKVLSHKFTGKEFSDVFKDMMPIFVLPTDANDRCVPRAQYEYTTYKPIPGTNGQERTIRVPTLNHRIKHMLIDPMEIDDPLVPNAPPGDEMYRFTILPNLPKLVYQFGQFMHFYRIVDIDPESQITIRSLDNNLFIAETDSLTFSEKLPIDEMSEWSNRSYCFNAIKHNPMCMKYVDWYVLAKINRDDLVSLLTNAVKEQIESLELINWVALKGALLTLDIAAICSAGIKRNHKALKYIDWPILVNIMEPRRMYKLHIESINKSCWAYDCIDWNTMTSVLSENNIFDIIETALTKNQLVLQNIDWSVFKNKLQKNDIVQLCTTGVKTSNLALMESSLRRINFNTLRECYGFEEKDKRMIVMRAYK